MKKGYSYIYPCGLFFLFLLMNSCLGPDKTKKAQELADTSRSDTTVQLPESYKDPLFFIEGQLCQHLRRIHQDKSGNLWMGTNVYGLMRYNGDTLEYFSRKEGLDGGRITEIVEDEIGNVWFASAGGLIRYDGKAFSSFTEKDGLLNSEIWSLIIDRKGIFWIGTMDGVFRYDGKKFTRFPIPKAQVSDTTTILSYDRITSILEDKEGNLWFGTDGFGICRYDGNDFTHFTTKEGLCDNNISDMFLDKQGHVWVGTMFGGVCRYDGNNFTSFTRNGTIRGEEIHGFYEDKKGNIWFGVENVGVYCYDGKTFTNYYENEGLETNGILCMTEDREGRFWFGGWGGLFRFDGKTFISVTRQGPWE